MNATLQEVDTVWSIDDAADAHDAMDWFDALESDASRKAESKTR